MALTSRHEEPILLTYPISILCISKYLRLLSAKPGVLRQRSSSVRRERSWWTSLNEVDRSLDLAPSADGICSKYLTDVAWKGTVRLGCSRYRGMSYIVVGHVALESIGLGIIIYVFWKAS